MTFDVLVLIGYAYAGVLLVCLGWRLMEDRQIDRIDRYLKARRS